MLSVDKGPLDDELGGRAAESSGTRPSDELTWENKVL